MEVYLRQLEPLIDRASELRSNGAEISKLWQRAKIIQIWCGKISTDGLLIKFTSAFELGAKDEEGERYFLGVEKGTGQPYFALNSAVEVQGDFKSLRELGNDLDSLQLSLAFHAIGLANWHATHPRCSRCGAETKVDLAGAVRTCIECSAQHHPRTDPAVIVLVRDASDRALLGRQAVWPEKRFSTFAGFVEPGESFENCVVREVTEESGVHVKEIRYLASQPWPFPASIMVAFEAITDTPAAARPDGEEIVEVRWYSRSEMKTAIRASELLLPPSMSVARKMIETWYCRESGFEGRDLSSKGSEGFVRPE